MAQTAEHGQPRLIVGSDRAALESSLAGAGLPADRPVVLLIGGAAKLEAAAATDLLPIVRDAIVATAQALGATLIDGGTDAGVMSLAGRSRRELGATVPLLGVAPIGRVDVPGTDGATGATKLEPNHTHVLLAPGVEWGDESRWLIDAARTLSGSKPVVVVVVDGGQVSGVEANKSQAEGWPLITIAGSGRTADDLARIARRDVPGAPVGSGTTNIYVTEMSAGAAPLAAMLRSLLEGKTPDQAGLSTSPDGAKIQFPALYVTASVASKRGRRTSRVLAGLELLFAIGGLAVAIVAALFPISSEEMGGGGRDFVIVAMAGSFLIAFALKLVGRAAGYEEDWLNGRAIAEAVKSHSWRYMTRVDPYEGDDADDQFGAELGGLMRRANDIRQAVDRLGSRPQQISTSMRRVRGLDLAGRRQAYTHQRLHDQADWYARKSSVHRSHATWWFWIAIVLQLSAAVTAILAVHLSGPAMTSDLGPIKAADVGGFMLRIMSLFASAAIAATAWTQLNRDDELARAYAYTFQELTLISGNAENARSEEDLAGIVHSGEEAIGRENRAWVAKRTERYESPDFAHAD